MKKRKQLVMESTETEKDDIITTQTLVKAADPGLDST